MIWTQLSADYQSAGRATNELLLLYAADQNL